MPSIWITSKSRPERSDAIHSFRRAADSATKRGEAADFDSPAPADAGTSPAGNRTDRANLRVATLISIWFMAHLPSQSSATAASQLGRACSLPKPWSFDLDIAAVEADLAPRLSPAVRPPEGPRAWRGRIYIVLSVPLALSAPAHMLAPIFLGLARDWRALWNFQVFFYFLMRASNRGGNSSADLAP